MELSDEILIPAARDQVYAALNDPEILKASIPGCEELTRLSDDEFAAKVHQDFVENLKSARVWGSATHDGQMVGRDHVLHDRDVVELKT